MNPLIHENTTTWPSDSLSPSGEGAGGEGWRAFTTVKSLSEDGTRIGGYLLIFSDAAHRDLQNEYFTKRTDLGLDYYSRRPVLYHHGLDKDAGGDLIGVIDTLAPDEVGVWCEAQLDKHHRYLDALKQLIARGALGWSSGSLPNLVQKSADGEIVRWVLVEASLTPTPAQPYHTTIHAIKSAYEALGLDVHPLGLPHPPLPSPNSERGSQTYESISEDQEINLDDLKTLTQTVSTLADAVKGLQAAPIKRLPFSAPDTAPRTAPIEVTRATKYSHLSAADMSFLYELLNGSTRDWRPDSPFMRELADKSFKAVNAGALPFDAVRGLADRGFTKANELDTTTQAGFGAEWAPDSWRSELWLRVRQDNVIAPLFDMVEMPTQPYELPIESQDPTVYFVPETTDQNQLVLTAGNPIPQSKTGSGKIQMSAKKLALRMAWSSELNEDSLIPVVANYRRQALRAMQNAIDNVLINGDTVTTANTNVNLIDGTPTAGTKYLAFNGLRKYCLVTNAAQSKNAAGAPPTMPLLRQGRFLMSGAYALRPRDSAWIVDDSTYAKLLNLPEFATMDKAGIMATNLTGQVGVIDGVPVFASAEVGLSQAADGKISATPANNTKGQAVLVFRPNWLIGYRRQVQAQVEYLSWADVFHLTVTARLCLVSFDSTSASELFNLAT